jgi:histidyl-tRNA synthetase
MSIRAPKGTDDILAPTSRTWRRMLRVWDRVTEEFGYDLIVTPLFEATELFSRGSGEDTEIVQKQMYTFTDKGGRSLTLRPEATPSVVRAHQQAGGSGIRKAASWGPMFRYERPQAGRRRQFYQLDVEYLGTNSPLADTEVIELGYRFLREIGLEDVAVTVNSIGDPVCRPGYLELLKEYLRSKEQDLCEDSRERIETNPLRVLDCKICKPLLGDAPTPVEHLCDACSAHYQTVKSGLENVGVPFVEDPHLVRGLDYYTRTAFEYIGTGLDAAQNAVGGGGRYDGLSESIGGPPIPGVGLALGLDRIVLALGDVHEDSALDVFVVVADEELREAATKLLSDLRGQDFRADFEPEGRSVKAQFKVASRREARRVLVIGDEWREGRATVRDMTTGEQREVPVEEVTEWLR